MRLFGTAAGPCALFALGVSLARYSFPRRFAEIAYLSLSKLILHPLIVWIFMALVFVVDPRLSQVGLLAAAMPTAATVFVLAEYYNTRVPLASGAILISTVLSLMTFPILAYFVLTPSGF
jgi:predicted permease